MASNGYMRPYNGRLPSLLLLGWAYVMGFLSHLVRDFAAWVLKIGGWNARLLFHFVVLSDVWRLVSGLGSMSSIAISYGENGPVFCGMKSDGSHLANCYGSNSAIIYEAPAHLPFVGLTAGDGFVCGLLMKSNQPYCWGSSGYIQTGTPQPMIKGAEYVEISAGDYHLCGLRKPLTGRHRNYSLVDCWGYNMTRNHVFDGQIQSISAGSVFNCGLFSQNRTVFCWGDETNSHVISLIPKQMRFQKISAGGYHVCGILEGVNSRAFCWGRSLDLEEEISVAYSNQGNVDLPPQDPMFSVVGGKFHACGIKSYDRGVVCWGYIVKSSTTAPTSIQVYEIAAGDYFTCGILAEKSLLPVCWGHGFPSSLPIAVSPVVCRTSPCAPGFYEFNNDSAPCQPPDAHVCLPCSNGCPAEMYQKTECTLKSDRQCDYNCSGCNSVECFSKCSSLYSNFDKGKKDGRFWSFQLPIIVAEIAFAVFLVVVVSTTAVLYVRYKLRNCQCSAKAKSKKNNGSGSSFPKDNGKIRPDLDEMKMRRAQMIANVACKCVRMRGKERPSMDKVTTALERALAQLMGSPCNEQPILPTEVVLGSSRMHKKSSQRSSNRSETDVADGEDQRIEFRAPSWITFPSVTSSQGRKSSVSEADVDGKTSARNLGFVGSAGGDALRSLEEEIGPASPQESLFLQHNF
ncbi:hypothetical protein Tsubulata_032726 [Turnera subulata]|uniref:non-specific serine/threonine protein kinase n=1 Tax=Turnera subulata TaxID=218843 RepID=A0A9Q0JKF6_9ROSI|nr:hypothetical protein Tsubulata_032726 [Turnera subulata]